jgi:hypothetical protein
LSFKIYFDLLFMRLSQFYDQSRKFRSLTWVKLSYVLFSFYEIISVWWPESWVWWIDSGCFFYAFLIDFFFQYHTWMLGWFRIEIHNLFFIGLTRSYDSSYRFDRLTRITFLGPFLIDFFSSISSFNIELIEN